MLGDWGMTMGAIREMTELILLGITTIGALCVTCWAGYCVSAAIEIRDRVRRWRW